jgi:hypothetical protein
MLPGAFPISTPGWPALNAIMKHLAASCQVFRMTLKHH